MTTNELTQNNTDCNELMVSTSREVMIIDSKSLIEYCENEIKRCKEKLKNIFPSRKKKCILWELGLERIYNDLKECGYKDQEIQKIIRSNKDALPLMAILIDRVDNKNLLKDKNFIDNVNNFFDLAGGKYKSLLKSSSFNTLIDSYYKTKGNEIADNDLNRYLELLYLNGYSKGLFYVRELFKKAFYDYGEIIDSCNRDIEKEKTNIEQYLETNLNPDDFKHLKEICFPLLNGKKSIKEAIANKINNSELKNFEKFKKIKFQLIRKLDTARNKINKYEEKKEKFRHLFINRELKHFDYFQNIICAQVLYDDFPYTEIEQTFFVMCDDLKGFLDKYVGTAEEEIFDTIKNSLENIIPNLIDSYVSNGSNINNRFYAHYRRLDRIFQKLYTYTVSETTKIKILELYRNEDNAPIPFDIIKDSLNKNTFSTTDKDAHCLIVPVIEKRYKKLSEYLDCDIDPDSLLLKRLRSINTNAIYSLDSTTEDVRKDAFKWYFDYEKDTDLKKQFCWEVIEHLDRLEDLKPCDNENYSISRDFLIENESDDEINKKLTTIMAFEDSKGLIADFVGGFSKYGGNTSKFGMDLKSYELKHPGINLNNWDCSLWDKRK